MVGGMISSAVLTLIVIPAIYAIVKTAQLVSTQADHGSSTERQRTSIGSDLGRT
jgi:hypothetical protein